MTTDIMKAIQKKQKKHPIRTWWNKNSYKVLRVVLFPLLVCICAHEKFVKYLNSRQSWNEERARQILSYYVPSKADWDEIDQDFYFFDNGMGWGNLAKRHLKRKDRRFWDLHRHKIRRYLIDDFELDGFVKEVRDCSDGWTELIFRLK